MYQRVVGRQYKQRLGKTRGDAAEIVMLGRSTSVTIVALSQLHCRNCTVAVDRFQLLRASVWRARPTQLLSCQTRQKQWVQEFQSIAIDLMDWWFQGKPYDKLMNLP